VASVAERKWTFDRRREIQTKENAERIWLFLASARTKSVKVNWPSCASMNNRFAKYLNFKLAAIYRTEGPPCEKTTNLSRISPILEVPGREKRRDTLPII